MQSANTRLPAGPAPAVRCTCGRQRRVIRRAVRTSAILAPLVSKQVKEEKEAESSASAPGMLSAFSSNASQFVNGLRLWPGGIQAPQLAASVLQKAKQDSEQSPQALPEVSAFLQPCSSEELRYMRTLSHLCSQTYYMGTLVPSKVKRWHGMELVSTSLACERVVYYPAPSPEQSMYDGDGMGVSVNEVMDVYKSLKKPVETAPTALSNVVPFPKGLALSRKRGAGESSDVLPSCDKQMDVLKETAALQQKLSEPSVQQQLLQPLANLQRFQSSTAVAVNSIDELDTLVYQQQQQEVQQRWNPADMVAAKLSEAAAAASSAALQPLASAAGSLYAGFVSSAFSAPSDRVTSATIAGIASAEVAASHPNSKEVKAASTSDCPSEWFVVDDNVNTVRYFVIQGSDSVDHWKTNITFEPMMFEGLGIKVHRGAYEAALALYGRFLPLVQEHADKCPYARICFTGHSIGGSLATLLMLMFRARGVLAADQIAPVYTFGSPAIFGACTSCRCGGEGEQACSLDAGPVHSEGLLAALDLPEDIIRNMFMSRDFVPRAFACDYSMVADLLRSWGPTWREHCCLTSSKRKQMYAFVGQMIVLQPSRELTTFSQDPYHPMLVPKSEAWVFKDATLASTMAACRDCAAAVKKGKMVGEQVGSVEEALAALMDNPHPLETLADPGAYMESGSISRYHNPHNYTQAMGRLLAERREQQAEALAGPSAVPQLASMQRAFFPVASALDGMDELRLEVEGMGPSVRVLQNVLE